MSRPEADSLEQLRLLKELDLAAPLEATQIGRDGVADGTHKAPQMLTCIRNVWSRFDMGKKGDAEIFNNLNTNRKCPYFFRYNAGYSPAEHRELQREAKTHWLLIRGMIWAAVIGAVAAIAGQLIAR